MPRRSGPHCSSVRCAVPLLAGAVALGAVTLGTVGLAAVAGPAHAEPRYAADYVVVLKDALASRSTPPSRLPSRPATGRARANGAAVHREFQYALQGFAATLTPAQLAAVKADPDVDHVEPDAVVHIDATQDSPPSWGLDRIDQSALPLDGGYTYQGTGANVTAYVFDTGITSQHGDLAGRVAPGENFVPESLGTEDCNGHGTHVAGIIGGTTHGVAKGVTLAPVRVLDCSGSGAYSQVIGGIDWVTRQTGPRVANMSLGGPASPALDLALTNSIAAGVVYAVAAGNESGKACNYSPARVRAAITVGATGATTSSGLRYDARPAYSNYGECLDLFAPGTNIVSDWRTSTSATATLSGTSMATPHVTGAAAVYLANHQGATPAAVATALINASTKNVVIAAGGGSPNRLLRAVG